MEVTFLVILNYYSIFDESNLIQMLGRLQRGLNSDLGEGYIISNHRSKQIDNTIIRSIHLIIFTKQPNNLLIISLLLF